MFPFVGAVPNKEGHWMAAGFVGHGKQYDLFNRQFVRLTAAGMPRILLSTANIIPGVLDSASSTGSRRWSLLTLGCLSLSWLQQRGWKDCRAQISMLKPKLTERAA